MLLRLRIALPDRPGGLGRVARALGEAGADIIQMTVLERVAGRAVDDFTVVWPASAPVDRVVSELTGIAGVKVEGAWRGTELPESSLREIEIVGQVATAPERGLQILADAASGVVGAEWSMVVAVDSGWADSGWDSYHGITKIAGSWQAPARPPRMEITPVRPRASRAHDGTHLAVAPLQRDGLVIIAARGGPDGSAGAPAFHRSEVERLSQLVATAAVVMRQLVTT